MLPHSVGVGIRLSPEAARFAVGETPAVGPPLTATPPPLIFRDVFDSHVGFVWRSLLGLGVSESDVPDASQQVFVVVHGKLDKIEAGCTVRTFIYGVCLRVASDWRRRAHVKREFLMAEPPESTTPPAQETDAANRQALLLLQEVLDRLDPAQREIFVLYELEELEMAEVARAVGCPLQTAYSRLHAARRAVAAALAPLKSKEER